MTPTEAQIAWAAGLFEGEGCIHNSPRNQLLILRTTDADVLNRFAAVVECGVIRGPLKVYKPHHKPCFEWRVCRRDQRDRILVLFLPWLGARRRAAAEALLARPVTVAGPRQQSHCRRGHPLCGPGSDVHVTTTGGRTDRVCRPCRRINAAARRDLFELRERKSA